MKRILYLLLAAALTISCTSCAKKAEQAPNTPDANTEVKDDAQAEAKDDAQEEGLQPVSEPVTISAWYTFGNTNEENFLKAIADFNASQEFIKVEATQQTWSEINAKIMAALSAHEQPDLIFCSAATDANNYVDMGVAVDLYPYITDKNIGIPDFDDFNSAVVEECMQWDGHMYMMPLSRTGEVMYYNADFFKEHELTPPTTWDELEALCKKITEISGKEALGSDYLDENYVDMVTQLGGSYIDYANKTASFDTPEARTVFEYWKGLESNGYLRLKGDDRNLNAPFSAGLIQMILSSSASYSKLFTQNGVTFDVGVCQIPKIQDTTSDYVTMWGVNAVILKSDELRQQAAYEFLKFWTSTEYQTEWAIGYDAMPVRESAINSEAYQEYLTTAKSTSVLIEEKDRLGFQPAVTGGADTNNILSACIDEILLGTLSIDDAISQYKADADAALQG